MNHNDNNTEIQPKYPNELYKLSLIAILNPIDEEDKNNYNKKTNEYNTKGNAVSKVNESKMRNILRRSLENFDNNIHEKNIKKRKFDFIEYQTDHHLEYSSSASIISEVPSHIRTSKIIK